MKTPINAISIRIRKKDPERPKIPGSKIIRKLDNYFIALGPAERQARQLPAKQPVQERRVPARSSDTRRQGKAGQQVEQNEGYAQTWAGKFTSSDKQGDPVVIGVNTPQVYQGSQPPPPRDSEFRSI